ncbi:hypothetical protein H2201_003856 [Coniosporium apollinis]|uniref:Apple domain-containing protein n=1 Tax=Coniosporium apollinis TaxID=61459 RepID=A0ABQ9NU77_9PEZI|nr:hypothetical protein H2201_003856 [Coniosporium apollinis]
MRVAISSILLSSLIPRALAQVSLSLVCITKEGKSSLASVGTTTTTLSLFSTAKEQFTTTPSSTVTPPPDSTTMTDTAWITETMTLPTVTDHYTSSSTIYDTSTETATITTTTTTQIDSYTTTTPVTTVPTSPGFIPVASGFGFPGFRKRMADAPMRFEARAKPPPTTDLPILQVEPGKKNKFPETVSCTEIALGITTETKTHTAKNTATVTAEPSIITAWTTTTLTTTSTVVPPNVQVTTVFVHSTLLTETATQTNTETSTTSSTITVVAPTSTYYAACGPENVVRNANGGTFNALQISGSIQPSFWSNTPTAYDCCVRCMNTPNCALANWAGGQCMVHPIGGTAGTSGGVCNVKHYFGNFFQRDGLGDPWTISNGNCGQFSYGMGSCYRLNGGDC